MRYSSSRLQSLLTPIVVVGLISASSCGSGSEEGTGPTTSDVAVTAIAPPVTSDVTSPVTTTATQPSLPPLLPEGPWWTVGAPEQPALQPRPGFEALGDVTSFCIRIEVADGTAIPSDERVAGMLASLGYTVLNEGCDATLAIDLVGHADPVSYSGDMVCYLEKSVTGLGAFIVGEQLLGPWEIDETSPAPTLTTKDECPGSSDPVSVKFWEDRLPSAMYETVGNFGLAAALLSSGAIQQIGMAKDLQALEDGVEAELLADPLIMQFLASVFGDGSLANEHLWFIEVLTEELDRLGIGLPAGMDHLIPALLRTAERERDADDAWSVIAWITGIPERNPEAVWAWYESS